MRRAHYIRRMSSSSIQYGGMDEVHFRRVVEEGAPWIKNVMCVKVDTLSKGKLTLVLPFKSEYMGNVLVPCQHGGVVASLLDHTGGFCAWTTLEKRHTMLNTVDLRIDYLKPAPCEDLICEAVVIQPAGKRLIRSDITVWNKDRSLCVASGRAVYNVYDTKKLGIIMPEESPPSA